MNRLLFASALVILISMGCTKKDKYSGYTLNHSETHKVIGSEVLEMTHDKSGASIVLVQNKDQARSFMAGFRTPPYDDSGVFHIFEHSVLAGSRNYPSKSNFFHMVNSSVASFINAMTGDVYTLYPFVSKSKTDFNNLFSVYLDAVFYPNTVSDPRIIKREGWRYELTPDKKSMEINGIVFSEMKGVFSSAYSSLYYNLGKAMLPQTPYGYSSGGLPSKIAGLSFSQIQGAHKKYYHPQNSVIYLYGDLDYPALLKKLDEEFLQGFDKDPDFKSPEIPLQTSFENPGSVVKGTYPGETGKNKDFLAKGYILGNTLDPVDVSAAHILTQAFILHTSAPFRLRILKEGLAQSTFYMSKGQEHAMSLVFEGTEAKNREKIDAVLEEELKKVIANGISENLLTSIINKYEFSQKEKNSNGAHRGMQLGNIVLDNWIYKDESLSDAFDFVTHFKKVRERLSDPAYGKAFFKKAFLTNSKFRWVELNPDPKFSENFNAGLDNQIQGALKEKKLEDFAKEDETYQQWVMEKESSEILDKVPLLKLSEIKGNEPDLQFKESKMGNTTLLQFPQNTSGISYVTLYFDLKGVRKKNLKKLAIFANLLKETDAGDLSFKELSQEIGTYLGGLSLYPNTYESVEDPGNYRPTFVVSMKFLKENKAKAFDLVAKVLAESQFQPEAHVNSLNSEFKTSMANSISSRAPSLSYLSAFENLHPAHGAFLEETEGGVFEKYLKEASLDAKELGPHLRDMLGRIFNQKSLYLVALTSDANDMESLQASLKTLKSKLPSEIGEVKPWDFSDQEQFDAFGIPGEVQYVTELASYKKAGLTYTGAMQVYSRYLNNNYMTPKLREQAGAYGGGARFSRNGLFTMSTYRDPNLKQSFETFENAVEYMKTQKISQEQLNPAVLGSLKPYYADKSVYGKTSERVRLWLTDMTWDDYLTSKEQILKTTPEDLAKISAGLETALKTAEKSVAGNKKKIQSEAPFLKNVLSLE